MACMPQMGHTAALYGTWKIWQRIGKRLQITQGGERRTSRGRGLEWHLEKSRGLLYGTPAKNVALSADLQVIYDKKFQLTCTEHYYKKQ